MAWLQVHFKSNALMKNVSVNVLIPAETPMFPRRRSDWRTMYLLHGVTGDNTDWLLNTDIGALSQAADTCIVLVSGDNSYFLDGVMAGMKHSTFLGTELIDFTRRLLPLSPKREDTIIAGLSMGGYGALYNGLRWNNVFGHIIALSSAAGVTNAIESTEQPNWLGFNRAYYRAMFGSDEAIAELETSEYNIPVLAKRVLEAGADIPSLYVACGWNDFLVPNNRKLKAAFEEMNFPHFYEEGAGTHEWAFWSKYLRRGLERIAPIPKMSMKGTPLWVDDPRDGDERG